MFLVIARTFKEALKNFARNGWLSVAAVTILFLSLFVVSLLFVVSAAGNNLLRNIQDKANISVYFKPDVSEEDIMKVKSDMTSYSEIKSIDYVSRDKALEDFKRNNADEPVIIKSLDELGTNPLLASLVIKANNPNQYESISKFINDAPFKDNISRVNYGKNKEVIDKLNGIVSEVKRIGLSLSVLFAVISVLIVFNTIRITIYTHKHEIEVMRLVGASNIFIRMPFVFEGIIYGLIAMVFSTAILFVTLKFITPQISRVLPADSLMSVFSSYILIIIGIQLLVGIFLGVLSGIIAIRKYLKT